MPQNGVKVRGDYGKAWSCFTTHHAQLKAIKTIIVAVIRTIKMRREYYQTALSDDEQF